MLDHRDPRFAALEDLFQSGVAEHETGAAVALRMAGRTVLHSWGGYADRRSGALWTADSLCCAFSVTKAFSALIVLQAAAQREIDLDVPVARYWRSFAANDKAGITLRQVLAHQSGVIGCRAQLEPTDYLNGTGMAQQLAAEPPWWHPGTRHGYQARTFGLLLDETLKRATDQGVRQRLGQLAFDARVDTEFYLGVPDHALSRCVRLEPTRATPQEMKALPEETWKMLRSMADPETPTGAAFQNPKLSRQFMNETSFQQADLASSGIHGTAAGIATVFDALWTSLPASLRREAVESHSLGQDEVLLTQSNFGLGLMLSIPGQEHPFGSSSFGHVGSGGAVLFHNPDREATIVFLPNRQRAGVMSWGPTAEAMMSNALSDL